MAVLAELVSMQSGARSEPRAGDGLGHRDPP
jgi:hypothetical protein